jgi:hypothetical protein
MICAADSAIDLTKHANVHCLRLLLYSMKNKATQLVVVYVSILAAT